MSKNFTWQPFLCAATAILGLLFVTLQQAQGQTVITTTNSFSNNNGSGTVTFNFENTNAFPVVITDISGVTGSSGSVDVEVWYNTTPISGTPGVISTTNGWVQAASGSITGVANTTTTTLQSFFSGLSITIPANTTYGMAVYAAGQRYYTMNSDQTFSAGGCNLLTGTNISYGGGAPNSTAPGNTPRGWIGSITFVPAGPGDAVNDAAVTALTAPVYFCSGTEAVKIKVTNPGANVIDSVKVGWSLDAVTQTPYNLTLPLDTVGGSGIKEREITLGSHTFTSAPVNLKAWTYLPNGVADTANTNDTISLVLHASMSGTFTIDANSAMSTTNYQTIDSFVSDLEQYGVCGPVVANVVPGSGPYNEIVNIGDIPGASSVNTIRINGNGETVQYNNTTSDRQMLILDGAKYVTIDSLKFKTQDATYGWGALITNGSEYDSIMRCEFDLTSITSTASASSSGLCFSASATSATSAGSNGSHCYVGYNQIKGTTGSGSCYYGISVAGTSDSNVIEHNLVENFYYYGIYISGATGTHVLYNDVNRETKTDVTTFYGIYTTGDVPGTQIVGNKVHAPGGTNGSTSSCYAMYLLGDGTATQPVLVANNAVYDINQGGTVYSMYLSTSPYNLIYNNTANLDQALSSTSTNYGIYATGTNTGTEIKNNNISITAGGTGTKYGFYYSTNASIDDAQKNNFYVNSTQSGTQNYGYYASAFATQSAFQTANPTLEAGSPAEDPQFVNAATGNLTPQNTLLIGQGMDLSNFVPKDINGNPRPATPTIGAFEQPPTGNNNAATIALLSPTGNYCPGSQMVNISVYNAGVNNITSLQVNWSVNGVTQTPVSYTGTLVPLTSTAGQNSDTIALGNAMFSNTTPTTIDVWLSLPNGTTDTIPSNDSLFGTFQATQYTVLSLVDTQCAGNNATINLSPNSGYAPGEITWQSSGDGSLWTDIANSDTVSYTDSTITASTWYRVKVGTGIVCYSDSFHVTVLNLSIDSVHNAERCDTGVVTLEAFGTPGTTIKWYDDPTGTTPVYSGNSYSPSLTATDTFYVSSTLGSGGGNGIRITEMNIGNTDGLEIQNVSGAPVDVTGWKVAISDDYTTITTVNSIVQTLNGVLNAGDILSWTDASTASNYWGNNILWDPTGKGWVILIDANNNVVDFVSQDWPESTLQTTSLTISGVSINLDGSWTGSGLDGSTAGSSNSFLRFGNTDNDDASDFEIASSSIGTQNSNIVLPFSGIGGGCESTREPVIATINPIPAVDLGNDTSICPGASTIVLDAGGQGASYLWNTGASSQTITINTGMTYSVTVTGTNGCTNSDAVIVQNGTNPVRVLPTSLALCAGDIDSLNAGNPGSTYSWNSGESTQKLGVQTAGTYNVNITSATGCTIKDSTTVIVHALPVVNLGADTALCPGDNVTLDAGNTGSGNSFQWNTTATTQTISASDSGIYAVTVTNVYGCQQNDSIHIATNPAPISVLPDTTDWCTGTMPNLDAGNVGSDYLWSTGDISQTVPVNASGTYTVTITNTYGCSITSATEVVVRQTPIVNLRADTSICSGVSITLDAGAQPSGSSYEWSNGDSTQTTQAFGGGLYTATVTNQYGCITSDDVNIGLLPNPVVSGINEAQNANGSFTFSASGLQNIGAITGYEWDFGDNTGTSTLEHPTHVYASNGIYTVRLVVFSICGSDTVYKEIQITVNGIGQISLGQAELKLYPNPATDQITIKNESTLKMAAIQVYNILGQKILNRELSDPNAYTLHTQELASGVYQIRISFTNGEWLTRKFEIKK